MFKSVQIVGRGRVGSAIAARLHERGVSVLEAGAELVLLEPRLAEHGVGVRIDEAGSENTASAIDYFGVGIGVLDITRRTDHRDAASADGDGGVPKDSGIAHLLSFARSRGAGAGHQLRCVDEEEISQDSVIRGFARMVNCNSRMVNCN
jgi:glycine/D-amino acid oxidase-like deaminating enzyme